jgi:hypothetical protein
MALTIGQVAAAADANIQTIRYYERGGLFAAPRRTPSGYRAYATQWNASRDETRASSHFLAAVRRVSLC